MAKIRGRGKVGDILRIDLGNNTFGYGRILHEPLMAFYATSLLGRLEIDAHEIVSQPVLFKVWVMNYAAKSDKWEIIGNLPIDQSLAIPPKFFKQDIISKKFYIYGDDQDIPATKEECVGLERAAAWEPEHVENRLRNYFAGIPDPMTERLKCPA